MKVLKIKKIIEGWRKNHPFFFFLACFAVIMVIFYAFYGAHSMQDWFFTPLVNNYALLSGGLLNLMGQQTTIVGDTVSSSAFSIAIKKGCDAAEPMALFAAGLLAFPVPIRKKLIGVLGGLSVIFALNIVRIITLFIIGVYKHSLFDAMHFDIWQVIFILVVIAMWHIWIRWAVKKVRM